MRRNEINPDDVIQQVCEFYNSDRATIFAANGHRRRIRRHAWIRQVAAWLLVELGLSALAASDAINCHHANVIHGKRTVDDARACYQDIKTQTDKLQTVVSQHLEI